MVILALDDIRLRNTQGKSEKKPAAIMSISRQESLILCRIILWTTQGQSQKKYVAMTIMSMTVEDT